MKSSWNQQVAQSLPVNASLTANAPNAIAKLRRSQVITLGRAITWSRMAAAKTP